MRDPCVTTGSGKSPSLPKRQMVVRLSPIFLTTSASRRSLSCTRTSPNSQCRFVDHVHTAHPLQLSIAAAFPSSGTIRYWLNNDGGFQFHDVLMNLTLRRASSMQLRQRNFLKGRRLWTKFATSRRSSAVKVITTGERRLEPGSGSFSLSESSLDSPSSWKVSSNSYLHCRLSSSVRGLFRRSSSAISYRPPSRTMQFRHSQLDPNDVGSSSRYVFTSLLPEKSPTNGSPGPPNGSSCETGLLHM